MNKICSISIVAAIIAAPAAANAYSANITLHAPAQKQSSDDLVVIDETFVLHNRECYFQSHDSDMALCPGGQNSIMMYLTPPKKSGFNTGFFTNFDGLDVVTDAQGWVDGATYHLRAAFTPEFTWVEINRGGNFSPIYDTVFFIGPSQSEYNWYMDTSHTTSLGYVYYSNLSSLKDDVQNNYANWAAYPTGVPSGVFLFKKNTGVAIFNAGPGATD